MVKSNLPFIVLLLMLTGCHQVPITREVTTMETMAHELTQKRVSYHEVSLEEIEDILEDGLSRENALALALLNNRALKASFQELGIAKADLVQAGLLKNPLVSAGVHIPKSETGLKTDMELQAPILSLTDLWEVPLRKRVYGANLDRAISRLVHQIFQTMGMARHDYDHVLFLRSLLAHAQAMVLQAEKLRDNLHHRHAFGLQNDADVYLAEASVGYWQMKVTRLQADLFSAKKQLSYILGLDPANTLTLTETFNAPSNNQCVDQLVNWALTHHPEVQRATRKITYYQKVVKYESFRRVKVADLGVAFKQEFAPEGNQDPELGGRGVGPYFAFEIPIFDSNQAQVARAKYQLKQAEQELCDIQLKLKADILAYHQKLLSLDLVLANYESAILSFNKKALAYTEDYQQVMQITIPTVIQTQKELYKAQKTLLEVTVDTLDTYTNLEQAVGKRLKSFTQSNIHKENTFNHLN